MKRTLYLVLAPAVLALPLILLTSSLVDRGSDPPRAGHGEGSELVLVAEAVDAAGEDGRSRGDDGDDDEGAEAPVVTSLPAAWVEEAVWDYIEEEMRWAGGVLKLDMLPGRELVPIWMELPRKVNEELFEVAVEMMAVSLLPSDFTSIGDIGRHPSRVPRTAEQATAERARTRGPGSWEITFEVLRLGVDELVVVDARVTGRPGERRPLRRWFAPDS